jgi:hypothetical protein
MDSMTTREDFARSLDNPENAQKLNGLVEDARDALMDYQVCTYGGLTLIVSNVFHRLRYRTISTARAAKIS